MRFLLDQDVYAVTGRFLGALGHDVESAARLGLSRAADEELLETARTQNRIFVTRDRDYGALVFVRELGAGVLYLRMTASNQNAVHNELERVLKAYAEEELSQAFVVIEADKHRFRRLRR